MHFTMTMISYSICWDFFDLISMHDTTGFYYCHVTPFWNWISTANWISGSRSDRFNLCKLPGCFSYGLGMRLVSSFKLQKNLSYSEYRLVWKVCAITKGLSDSFSSLQFARWLCSSQFGHHSKIPFHQEHMPLIRTTMAHELRTGKLVQYKLWLWILTLFF